MTRPTWILIYAIFMLLIGGCSVFSNLGDMNADKIVAIQGEVLEDMEKQKKEQESKSDTMVVDSAKLERMRRTNEKLFEIFGDTIARDSSQNVDVVAVMKDFTHISEYRMYWTKKLAFYGLIIAILFIISGIVMLVNYKHTVPIVLTTLSTSLVLGIFRFITMKADTESGAVISTGDNFGIMMGLAIDVILILVFMILDKSYFKPEIFSDDYQ